MALLTVWHTLLCAFGAKAAEEGCGEIRIVAANTPYKQILGPAYYDNIVYAYLVE